MKKKVLTFLMICVIISIVTGCGKKITEGEWKRIYNHTKYLLENKYIGAPEM